MPTPYEQAIRALANVVDNFDGADRDLIAQVAGLLHRKNDEDDPRGDDGPYSHEADGYMRAVPGELFDDDPEPSALGVVLSRAVFDVLDHDPEAFKRAGGVIVDE